MTPSRLIVHMPGRDPVQLIPCRPSADVRDPAEWIALPGGTRIQRGELDRRARELNWIVREQA